MATLYQRGDRSYLNWCERGRQWRRSLGAIEARAAEKIRREKEAQLTLGIIPASAGPTLAEWIDDYCEWRLAERGSVCYDLRHLRARLGHYPIATLPAAMVEQHKIERLRIAKPDSVGKEIRILKAALNRAVALGVIVKSPIAGLRPPKSVVSRAVQFYTREQLGALYAADPAMAPHWRFLANTGLRRGEYVKATREDIVEGALRVESTEAGRTKSGRWRDVPLNADAKASLEALGRARLCGYAKATLTHKFAQIAAQAAVGGNLHMLRHTFCSHLVMAGVSLRAVQVLAGHSSYAVTERYAHLAPSHKAEAVDRISL